MNFCEFLSWETLRGWLCRIGGDVGALDGPEVKKWVAGIEILARIASRFPQTAYAGLVSSLQAEWQYLCRVVPGAE